MANQLVDTIHRDMADQRLDAEFAALEAKYKEILTPLQADVARRKSEHEQLMSNVNQLRQRLAAVHAESQSLDARKPGIDQLQVTLSQQEARLANEKSSNATHEANYKEFVDHVRWTQSYVKPLPYTPVQPQRHNNDNWGR